LLCSTATGYDASSLNAGYVGRSDGVIINVEWGIANTMNVINGASIGSTDVNEDGTAMADLTWVSKTTHDDELRSFVIAGTANSESCQIQVNFSAHVCPSLTSFASKRMCEACSDGFVVSRTDTRLHSGSASKCTAWFARADAVVRGAVGLTVAQSISLRASTCMDALAGATFTPPTCSTAGYCSNANADRAQGTDCLNSAGTYSRASDTQWMGTEEDAETKCDADSECLYLYDHGNDGGNWRACRDVTFKDECVGSACADANTAHGLKIKGQPTPAPTPAPTREYIQHQDSQCTGSSADVLRDFAGTPEQCKAKCDELGCPGFICVESGSTCTCYFRGGTLSAVGASNGRSCFVPS